MTKKIVGATYTVTESIDEYPFNTKIVLIEDDDTDMPLFTLKQYYDPSKSAYEMDWKYVFMKDVSLDEDVTDNLVEPFKISTNGITVTMPKSIKSITINNKTNAIKISWEEV